MVVRNNLNIRGLENNWIIETGNKDEAGKTTWYDIHKADFKIYLYCEFNEFIWTNRKHIKYEHNTKDKNQVKLNYKQKKIKILYM